MSLTSGKISHDPEPWRSRTTFERYPDADAAPEVVKTWGMNYAPRPEFDNHNGLLVCFRTQGPNPGTDAADWVRDLDENRAWWSNVWPADVLAHARRVLTKLATLTTTTNGVTD